MEPLLIAAAAFAAMEPVTAAVHRFVMHGVGWVLHRSHHEQRATRFEANDAFPVMFAAIVCIGVAIGFNVEGWSVLVPVGAGVTLYGAAYSVIHDVYIHGRLRWFGNRRVPLIQHLADAHRLHHLLGGAPFGMLLPVVPNRVRERVTAAPRS